LLQAGAPKFDPDMDGDFHVMTKNHIVMVINLYSVSKSIMEDFASTSLTYFWGMALRHRRNSAFYLTLRAVSSGKN
jgi:hypothetical protein